MLMNIIINLFEIELKFEILCAQICRLNRLFTKYHNNLPNTGCSQKQYLISVNGSFNKYLSIPTLLPNQFLLFFAPTLLTLLAISPQSTRSDNQFLNYLLGYSPNIQKDCLIFFLRVSSVINNDYVYIKYLQMESSIICKFNGRVVISLFLARPVLGPEIQEKQVLICQIVTQIQKLLPFLANLPQSYDYLDLGFQPKRMLDKCLKNQKTIRISPFFISFILFVINLINLVYTFIQMPVHFQTSCSLSLTIQFSCYRVQGLKTMFDTSLTWIFIFYPYFYRASIVFEIPSSTIFKFLFVKISKKSQLSDYLQLLKNSSTYQTYKMHFVLHFYNWLISLNVVKLFLSTFYRYFYFFYLPPYFYLLVYSDYQSSYEYSRDWTSFFFLITLEFKSITLNPYFYNLCNTKFTDMVLPAPGDPVIIIILVFGLVPQDLILVFQDLLFVGEVIAFSAVFFRIKFVFEFKLTNYFIFYSISYTYFYLNLNLVGNEVPFNMLIAYRMRRQGDVMFYLRVCYYYQNNYYCLCFDQFSSLDQQELE